MLAALLALVAPISLPPTRAGQCAWVRGRYAVYNGSSVRRIWVIGTHRIVAVADDDQDVPPAIAQYQQSPSGGALVGDFYVCAREQSRPGRMQQVRLLRTDHLVLKGKPIPSK